MSHGVCPIYPSTWDGDGGGWGEDSSYRAHHTHTSVFQGSTAFSDTFCP